MNAQEYKCLIDSLFYCNVDSFINTKNSSIEYHIKKEVFNLEYSSDDLCIMKRFAAVFDFLFNYGLVIDRRIKFESSRDIFIWASRGKDSLQARMYMDSLAKRKVNYKNNESELFKIYIAFKKQYEDYFSNAKTNNTKDFHTKINNIIAYGAYTHPYLVLNTLSFNYQSITIDKWYNDYRYKEREVSRKKQKASDD